MLAAELERPSVPEVELTVRLYNLAEAPDDEVQRAAEAANAVFRRIGIGLVWLRCEGPTPDKACDMVSGPAVFNLRLMPAHMPPPEGLPKNIFGFALMSTRGEFAVTANVYFERVARISDGRKYRRPVVLGAVMAHELGHLLLGINSHSKKGLMTLPWGPKVLLAANRGMLGFSKKEAGRILEAAIDRLGRGSSPGI